MPQRNRHPPNARPVASRQPQSAEVRRANKRKRFERNDEMTKKLMVMLLGVLSCTMVIFAEEITAEQAKTAVANWTLRSSRKMFGNVKDVAPLLDEASGAKYFQWVDKRSDTPIPNMPVNSELALNDYSVDVNRRIAKNNNLNTTKRVIVKNSTNISRF